MTQLQREDVVDQWSDWLLHQRHSDDLELGSRIDEAVSQIRDRVLDGAGLQEHQVLADIGAGTGLVAFEAIRRVGSTLRVIYSDISLPLLKYGEWEAIKRGVQNQCSFVNCAADRLVGIADASVDVVTTRAVLAYVADKPTTLREFYRVLKPGGRISIAEPIFRDIAIENIAFRRLTESQPVDSTNRIFHLLLRWRGAQFPDTQEKMSLNSLTNFTERDLFREVLSAGFNRPRMEFHVELISCLTNSWEVFLGSAPHPLAPSLGRLFASEFTPDEASFLEQVLRPMVEEGQMTTTERIAYLTATKPSC